MFSARGVADPSTSVPCSVSWNTLEGMLQQYKYLVTYILWTMQHNTAQFWSSPLNPGENVTLFSWSCHVHNTTLTNQILWIIKRVSIVVENGCITHLTNSTRNLWTLETPSLGPRLSLHPQCFYFCVGMRGEPGNEAKELLSTVFWS